MLLCGKEDIMELSLLDQDFLETLYKAAEKSQYVDDIELFKKQAEALLEGKESPIEWNSIIIKLEEMYGYYRGGQ